jgi:hypothetical protein
MDDAPDCTSRDTLKSICIKELVSGTDVIPSKVKLKIVLVDISIIEIVKGLLLTHRTA